MADERSLTVLESLLTKRGHTKAARYLREEYVYSRLSLPKPGEPPVARLPSGRSISYKKPAGLTELAKTIERLHHGSVMHDLPQLVSALRDEMHEVRSRYQGNPWITATRPYRRLNEILSHPKESKTTEQILRSWSDYQTRHPGGATVQGWGQAVVRGLGFSADLYPALERLAAFNLEGQLLEVLEVIHSGQPVLQYRKAPVCVLLQQATVIPDSDRVARDEQVHALLRRVLAAIVGFLIDQGEKLDRLLDLVVSEDCIPGATPRQVLRTLWQVGEAHALKELSRAAIERTKALVLKPSPSAPVAATGPNRRLPMQSHEASPDWSALEASLNRLEPGLPEEVMRALLEAALKRADLKRRYGLPAGEYWIICPDPVLQRAGVERLRFSAGSSGLSVHCVTAPLALNFSLVSPPAGVTRGVLLMVLVAAIMYEAMVTQRDSFMSQESRGQIRFTWAKAGYAATHKVHRTVVARVARAGSRSAQGQNSARTRVHASFVVPHLRRLNPGGQPGPEAVVHAAEHGIRLPNGYTFVRGHLRGAGASDITREFAVAEIAMETISRLRRQQ